MHSMGSWLNRYLGNTTIAGFTFQIPPGLRPGAWLSEGIEQRERAALKLPTFLKGKVQ